MDYQKLIKERFSVRNFRSEQISENDLKQILKAGHLAPTGCNYQPYRILVMKDASAMEKLRRCTKCHFNAPAALLICHNPSESWRRKYDGALASPIDAAIVGTHMMLCAHDIGVGCCWVMHFDPEAMREMFRIPTYLEPLALLVMGYPAEDAKPIAIHEAYRPIEDLIVYNSFE